MTWSVTVQNNTGRTVVTPAASAQYYEGTQAVVAVQGIGIVQLLDVGHVEGAPHYWGVKVISGDYTGMWYYDGGGLCNLILNEDGTFLLEGQGQSLTARIGGPAPTTFQLPAGSNVKVNSFTNASFIQRVTLTVNGADKLQWQGSGENNHEIVDSSFQVPQDPSGWVNAAVLLESSPDGGRSWMKSRMSPVGTFGILGYNQRTIVAEDGADLDYNDVAVLLSWWKPANR